MCAETACEVKAMPGPLSPRAQRRDDLGIGRECELRRVDEREIGDLIEIVAGAQYAAGDGAAKPYANGLLGAVVEVRVHGDDVADRDFKARLLAQLAARGIA